MLPSGDNRVPVADPLARLGLLRKQARDALIVQLDALEIVNCGFELRCLWFLGASAHENGSPPQFVPYTQ